MLVGNLIQLSQFSTFEEQASHLSPWHPVIVLELGSFTLLPLIVFSVLLL